MFLVHISRSLTIILLDTNMYTVIDYFDNQCFQLFVLIVNIFDHLRLSSIIFDYLRLSSIIFDYLRLAKLLFSNIQ